MDTKNFLQINIYNAGLKMINIQNIALIEDINSMTKVTLNITDSSKTFISFNVNENYVNFTRRLAQLDQK
jgi:hypothetical protein